ncbi:MAG: GntR family transcriptional regulator [Gammaproteobacteria bacterium]|nr:GntR family transcriptional regulator [Gammaproteobacteria bacterium]MDE0364129.1 GntR family transcriptional regulator [Gammaproteobacteria bacterium]
MRKIGQLFTPMELASLRAEGPIPLYHQLYQLLKRRILSGTLAYGAKLPTEAELAEGFGVSRVTAKRVMDLLVADDLIKRQRGRGSHVIYEPSVSDVEAPLVGMLEKLASMSRTTKVRVLHVEKSLPPPTVVDDLRLPEDEQVHYVTRVRSSEDRVPFAYYESWTRGINKGFTAKNIERRTRFDIMAENGHRISRIEQYLSASAASPLVAEQLQMVPGDPVLTLVRHSFDDNGDVVDLLHCQYHPERFHYRMNLSMEDYAG